MTQKLVVLVTAHLPCPVIEYVSFLVHLHFSFGHSGPDISEYLLKMILIHSKHRTFINVGHFSIVTSDNFYSSSFYNYLQSPVFLLVLYRNIDTSTPNQLIGRLLSLDLNLSLERRNTKTNKPRVRWPLALIALRELHIVIHDCIRHNHL